MRFLWDWLSCAFGTPIIVAAWRLSILPVSFASYSAPEGFSTVVERSGLFNWREVPSTLLNCCSELSNLLP